jgi:hypothetical protein
MKHKKSYFKKTISIGLALILMIDTMVITALVQNYVLKKKFNRQLQTIMAANINPEDLVKEITRQVTPANGYTTSLSWGDLGLKLVESGAIDQMKYQEIFNSKTNGLEDMVIFDGQDKPISINENNSRFVVNTLWALGLVSKSKVLDEGLMKTSGTDTGNFASTGGWTLGSKDAMQIYSSQELIPLTDDQQDLVQQIALNVYRPCCGNHTAFPDCNHGMAALGYIELAVSKGLSEDQIYQDLLAFNSFWFPQTYVEMAVFFQNEKSTSWENIDAKLALGQEFSSAQGAQKIRAAVQNVPGLKSQGGSCGA